MAQYGITITWHELTGQRPTIAQLHANLAPYSLPSVLLGLARISAVLKTFVNRSELTRQIDIVARTLPTYARSINDLLATTTNRIAITRTSILFVAKQALLVCRATGPDAATPTAVEQITSCLLMANDLLLVKPAGPEDPTIAKAASMLTFSTYVPQDSLPTDIGRNLLLLEEIAPQLRDRADYIDLTAAFTTAAGTTPQRFCELIFCTGTKFINYVDQQAANQGLILDKTFFQHTTIPAAELDAFLAMHTTTLAALQARVQAGPGLENDFRCFQDRPLLEFQPGLYLCIDPGFLLDKAGKALYWTLHASTPGNQRVHLLGYWASLIDRYAHWHASHTYRGTGTLRYPPRFADGAEAADLLIREGDRLLLFEVKATILTTDAKYGFDPTTLADELTKKAIDGEPGERKGVAQLRHNITRILDGTPITDTKLDGITKIYPILVFLDDSFIAPYLARLYRDAFDARTLKRRGGPTITTLHAITVNDLEDVLPHTDRHRLCDIIDDYYQHNRTTNGELTAGGMSHGSIPLLRGEAPGHDPVRARFQHFADDLEHHAFPKEDRPSQ